MTDVLNDPEPRLLQWLDLAIANDASDLHLVSGYPPILRTHGKLIPIGSEPPLESQNMWDLLSPVVENIAAERLVEWKDLDFAIELNRSAVMRRFRVNLFRSNRTIGGCIRIIPRSIPDFSWTSFPEELARRLVALNSGLVLFTGVTGSGKSTSLAMIIEVLNKKGGYRILTIEDPIEYRFPIYSNSVVTQREVGTDVDSFADGLRFGLRQDPDLILVGEIRDLETARMALSAAETGHLVLATLHTRDAKGAISRYADIFPQQMQSEVRSQLATNLRAIICQRLLASIIEGEKQELALEILFNTHAISSAIRTSKLESIDNGILTGRTEGMLSMDESIKRLLGDSRITRATAEAFITDRAVLNI